MGKLTKKLLLQYALHSNKEIKEAYQLRLYDELLKKGLVSIEDIPFDYAKGINPNDFFVLLTDRALTYCETSRIWDIYFEIISKTKVTPIFVAYGVIKLCNSKVGSSIKERGYQWLRNLPETEWETRLIECLLEQEPFNRKLAKIALERSQKLSDVSAIEYAVEYIPAYDIRLKLIKILAAKKQQSTSVFLMNYCLKKLIPELSAPENNKKEKYLPKALKLLVYIVKRLTSSEKISEENCCLISNLYVANKIDVKAYLAMSAKLTKLADGNNNSYARYLADGLRKAAGESAEYLPQVEKIIKKQLAVLSNDENKRQMLYSLSLIAWNYKGQEGFKTEILPPLKSLFLSRVSAVQGGSSTFYRNFCSLWIEMDKEVFLQIALHAPENEYCEVIRTIATGCPELWDEFFQGIKLSTEIATVLIYHLVDIYQDKACAAVCEKVSDKIKFLLEAYKFNETYIRILSEKLQTVEEFKNLQVQSTELSPQEVSDVLSLLDE